MEEKKEGACAAMERQVIVSGGGELRAFSLPGLAMGARVQLEGACALCAGKGGVFCAGSRGDMIWRLGGRALLPAALFAGGPGIADLALSPDGRLLYALCADADSVLALDARSGAPRTLARAGLNPRRLALDGDVLAVTGGEHGETLLLHAQSLCTLARLPMPGPVCCVALRSGIVYSLCLNESLSSTLVTLLPGGIRQSLRLCGMPGALALHGGGLLAATQGYLYTVSPDGMHVLARSEAPGRAARLLDAGERLLLCDELTQTLFGRGAARGRWLPACDPAADAALAPCMD